VLLSVAYHRRNHIDAENWVFVENRGTRPAAIFFDDALPCKVKDNPGV
jgi:hypothetical protein